MQHSASAPPPFLWSPPEAWMILAQKWPSDSVPFSAQNLQGIPASLTYKTQGLCQDLWASAPPASLASTGPWTHQVSSTLWPSLLPLTLSGVLFPQMSRHLHSHPRQAYSDDTFSKEAFLGHLLKTSFPSPNMFFYSLDFSPQSSYHLYHLYIVYLYILLYQHPSPQLECKLHPERFLLSLMWYPSTWNRFWQSVGTCWMSGWVEENNFVFLGGFPDADVHSCFNGGRHTPSLIWQQRSYTEGSRGTKILQGIIRYVPQTQYFQKAPDILKWFWKLGFCHFQAYPILL